MLSLAPGLYFPFLITDWFKPLHSISKTRKSLKKFKRGLPNVPVGWNPGVLMLKISITLKLATIYSIACGQSQTSGVIWTYYIQYVKISV